MSFQSGEGFHEMLVLERMDRSVSLGESPKIIQWEIEEKKRVPESFKLENEEREEGEDGGI